MSYIWNRQSIGAQLKLDTSLSLSGFFPLLPLATEKTAIVSYLTPLPFLAWRTPWTCSVLYSFCQGLAGQSFRLSCHALTVFWLLSFRLWPLTSLASLALLIAAKKLTDIFCYCLLACPCCLVLLQIASFDSVLFSIFCFCSLLTRCLCLLFCGQKCGTLCGAQLFDFDCFVLIEMFLQLLPASLPLPPPLLLLLLLRALPRAEAEQRRAEHNC